MRLPGFCYFDTLSLLDLEACLPPLRGWASFGAGVHVGQKRRNTVTGGRQLIRTFSFQYMRSGAHLHLIPKLSINPMTGILRRIKS